MRERSTGCKAMLESTALTKLQLGGDKHTVDTKLHIPPLAVLYTLF